MQQEQQKAGLMKSTVSLGGYRVQTLQVLRSESLQVSCSATFCAWNENRPELYIVRGNQNRRAGGNGSS